VKGDIDSTFHPLSAKLSVGFEPSSFCSWGSRIVFSEVWREVIDYDPHVQPTEMRSVPCGFFASRVFCLAACHLHFSSRVSFLTLKTHFT
jgi:hypothetical protein